MYTIIACILLYVQMYIDYAIVSNRRISEGNPFAGIRLSVVMETYNDDITAGTCQVTGKHIREKNGVIFK